MSTSTAKQILSVPSKTFLMGEYAVLHGQPALVMAHGPRFQLLITRDGQSACRGIHPHSPAGRLMRQHAKTFVEVSLDFVDPHEGRGGFGASSAQFLLIYAFVQMMQQSQVSGAPRVDPETMWKSYRELHSSEEIPPSGADVMTQLSGGVTAFQMLPWRTSSAFWPFKELTAHVIPTGYKVATHEHLRERLPVSENLMKLSEQGVQAFQSKDSSDFLSAILRYAEELESLQLVTASTRGLIAQVAAFPEVLAAKGCGALGADVLLVISRTEDSSRLRARMIDQGFHVVGHSQQLESGLRLEVELSPRHISEDLIWA